MNALKRYAGHQNINTSIRWVNPQKSINAMNNQNMFKNGMSFRFLIIKNSKTGIAK